MKKDLWRRFVYVVLRLPVTPLIKLLVGYKCARLKGPDKPSLIVLNHCTDLDPILVALGLSRHMYFVASEHALRDGLPAKALKFLFDPIPFDKARADIHAIMETIRRLKAGANVCLFPEGDRTFTGETGSIAASTAKLAKKSGADLVTFKIEGGYFTTPRWAKKLRRGKTTGRVVNIYPADELKKMTDEHILSLIKRDVFEDAYESQKTRTIRYRGKSLAENIEIALFLCPGCRKLGTIHSEGDRFFCDCGLEGVFTETGLLEGETLPFSTTTEWGVWQGEQLREIVAETGDGPICSDECQQLFEVDPAAGKKLIGEGLMEICRENFKCAGMTFPIERVTRIAVVGRMTLLFSEIDGANYEVRSAYPRSALKYREIFRLLTEN